MCVFFVCVCLHTHTCSLLQARVLNVEIRGSVCYCHKSNCVQITHRIGQNSTGNLDSVASELAVWVRLTCILHFLHIKKHQHLRLAVRDLGGENAGYLIQGFTPAKYVVFH